jgi:autoinducer 2-binding periplasmic protein LuxP
VERNEPALAGPQRRTRCLALILVSALVLAACEAPDDEVDDTAVLDDPPEEEVAEPEEEPEEAVEDDEEILEDITIEGPEERGIYLLTEFFEAYPEHEQLQDALIETMYEDPAPFEVEVDEPLQIAFFLPSLEISDAWFRLEEGLKGRLDEIGIPYEIVHFLTTPENHSEQASQVETVLANPEAYDYALFAPTEWEAQKSHVERLAAEIPTFAYNVANPFYDLWGTDESPLTHVSFDHEVGALLLCEWAINETGGEGTVALLRFVRGFVDNLRSDTFGRCIEENSDLEVVIHQETDGDREMAFTGASTVLSAHPDLTFMHAASTAITLGAVAAMRERDAIDDVILNGWGGGSDELDGIINGEIDVTVFRVQDDWGVAGAEMIRMHLEGRDDEIPGVVSPGMMIIDHTWTEEEIEEQTDVGFRYSGDIDR